MKTFSDLIFEPHTVGAGAEAAWMKFPSGASISVIRGHRQFQAGQGTYEVLMFRPHRRNPTELRGYQDAGQITAIMKELQK